MTKATEQEFEPIRGLPEELPEGEVLLWQGQPSWTALALRAFHLKALGIYFGLLAAWRAATLAGDGATPVQVAAGAGWLLLLGVAVAALFGLFAMLAAKTTVYSITSRRLVFRIGVALPITLNLPFRVIQSAGLRMHGDGTGDIVMAIAPPHHIAYFMLWPHARPWRLRRPEPMLRAVPDAAVAAQVLSRALAAAAMVPVPAAPVAEAAGVPVQGAAPRPAAA